MNNFNQFVQSFEFITERCAHHCVRDPLSKGARENVEDGIKFKFERNINISEMGNFEALEIGSMKEDSET